MRLNMGSITNEGATRMNKDHVKGKTNEVTGEIKQQVGKLTGDRSLEAKGHARELKGKVQQGVGDAKDELRDDRALDRELDRELDKDKDLDR
jgi:uncharacterized protein YjbJ (UPF0337 family)